MSARFGLSYKHTNKSAGTVCCGNRKQRIGDLLFVVLKLSCVITVSSFFFPSFVPSAKLPPMDRDSAIFEAEVAKALYPAKGIVALSIEGQSIAFTVMLTQAVLNK
jgi:hypothetical protein